MCFRQEFLGHQENLVDSSWTREILKNLECSLMCFMETRLDKRDSCLDPGFTRVWANREQRRVEGQRWGSGSVCR